MIRKLLLVLIFLIIKAISFAQPFGANGATWTFSLLTVWPPIADIPITVTSSAPFVFNGDTCRTISVNSGMGVGCWIDSSFIVKESNDSVYYWLPTSNRFVMLYNYNAMVGDTQTIYGRDIMGGDTSMQVVITATGTININGVTKRTYVKQPVLFSSYFNFEGTTIEDIGNVSFFLFPEWSFCDPVMWTLRCYEDSIVGLYNRSNPILPCDTVIYLGINELNAGYSISVSPNPFTSEISITIQNKNFNQGEFTIRNILGQIVFKEQVINASNIFTKTIQLNELENGVYFLEVFIDGKRSTKIIVKE